MTAYGMQGTPTLILIDRVVRLRGEHFGHVENDDVDVANARKS